MTPESTPEVYIRPAAPDEAPAIADILYQAFVEYQPAYTPGAFAATTPGSAQIQNRWEEGPVWMAVHHDRPVGTLSAVSTDRGLYVRSMAILPAARGQGIGELLLQQAERFARDRGHNALYLSTTPFLLRAIRLYQRFGFRPTGEGPHDLHGTPLLTMVRPLD